MQPQNEDVTQIRFRVVLPVPVNRDSTAYHEDIRGSFIKSYKKEKKFQVSLQGLGTGTWLLDGRVMFANNANLELHVNESRTYC